MRRPTLATAAVLLTVVVLSGCGGDDAGRRTTQAAATDPASVLCRAYRSPDRETCTGSYFHCREDLGAVVDDIDSGPHPDARTISRKYASFYWSDWEPHTRAAARVGCRGGLRR